MPDLTLATDTVSVVEIRSDEVTAQILAPEHTGLIEVRQTGDTLILIDEPDAEIVGIVTAGPIGPTGPMGPQGPEGKLRVEEFHFASPVMEWVMYHTLGSIPVVTIYDLDGQEFSADVLTPDVYTVIVDFELPMAGRATLKA